MDGDINVYIDKNVLSEQDMILLIEEFRLAYPNVRLDIVRIGRHIEWDEQYNDAIPTVDELLDKYCKQ